MRGVYVWAGKCTKEEALYFIAYIIYVSIAILRTSFFATYIPEIGYKGALGICVILLVMKEILDSDWSIRLVLWIGLLLFLAYIIHKDGAFTTAVVLLFFYSARNISFDRIAKVSVILTCALLAIIVASAKMGIIENYVMDKMTIRPREFLGFKYALFPSAFLSNIVLLELYLKKRNIKVVELLVLGIINYWIYLKTDARLSFAVCMISIIMGGLLLVSSYIYKGKRILYNPFSLVLKIGCSISFIGCAIVSICLQIFYNDFVPWMSKLNSQFGSRLYYGSLSYQKYGIFLLGQPIEWIGNGLDNEGKITTGDYLYVDCMYLQVLQKYGIIIFFFVIFVFTLLMVWACYHKQYVLSFILLILAAHMMIDDLVLHLWYNTFWILAVQLLLNLGKKPVIQLEKDKTVFEETDTG